MLDQLQKPEYIHVLLNHLPITGLLVSATALLIALILRSRQGQICALAVIALCSVGGMASLSYRKSRIPKRPPDRR